MTVRVVAVASNRGKILAHALLPSAPSRRIVLQFRIHERKSVDARFRTITHTVTRTNAIDARVSMGTKSILACRGRKQGSPQMRVTRDESSRRNYA